MAKIIRNQQQLIEVVEKLKNYKLKEPIILKIEKLFDKRSNQQLRSFWLLIKVIKLWMNEQGNNFSDEEVATYFKIKSGHYIEKDNIKIAKSIAFNSDTSKKDMENIINTILDFGVENNIEDCYIDSYDLNELLINYKE